MHNTAKHTPGPWEVNKSDVCIIEIAKPLGVGCVLPIADVQYNPSRENPGQHVANAALIAAAPAMYLELKEGLVLLEASHHDMVDMYGTDSLQAKTVWERIESTRNTLAQAEGSKP